MGVTGTFKDLVDMMLVVPKLTRVNASLRQDIRDAVGLVADELTRGLGLVEARLGGAKVLARSSQQDRETALMTYMAETHGKLFEAFAEFKICRGLRETRDRFTRPFDLARASVRVGSIEKIHRLLHDLENDERLIIDEVAPLVVELSAAAAGPSDRFIALVDEKIKVLRQRGARIKRLARQVHKEL